MQTVGIANLDEQVGADNSSVDGAMQSGPWSMRACEGSGDRTRSQWSQRQPKPERA